MTDINNSTTKKIIDIYIKRMKESTLNEDYEPREEMDFVDVFFRKLCAIYGTKICLEISEGKDIESLLNQRGLSVADFSRIEAMMKDGMNHVEKSSGSLSSIFEVENACNDTLKSYAETVAKKLEQEGKKIDLDIIKKAIEDSFTLNSNIYTPCSEYEKDKTNVK